MKSQSIIYLLIGIVVIITMTYSCLHSSTNKSDISKTNGLTYSEQVLEKRKQVEEFLNTSEESPIKDKKSFKGLKYYEPNEKYKVTAKLSQIKEKSALIIQTSTGESQTYIKYAYANFDIDGVACKLLLLKKNLRDPRTFVPFTDLTSGKETYGAGRYLDIPILGDRKEVIIDFNLSYNPYCAYNYKYSCPVPPKENNLSVAIKAGEKNYE